MNEATIMNDLTVREYLIECNTKRGYGTDTGDLIETLIEDGVIIHRGSHDTHRWYIIETVVAKLGDKLIEYDDYIITGDDCMSDMDLEYDIDNAKIVTRKERTIVEVYYD